MSSVIVVTELKSYALVGNHRGYVVIITSCVKN